jgi:hypothetical protein
VRLEDLIILGTFIFFIFQVLRKKIKLKKAPLFWPMTIYIVIGFLSTLSAIFITKTIHPEWIQLAKIYFHWLRRIEYFFLFFIFFFGLKSVKQINKMLLILGTSVIGVSVYGFGQKYLYWPAYSTMNREFSKGIALYLTEHARVLSTFGGHFDLAAYIMITLIPLILLGLLHPQRKIRLASLSLAGIEYWLLILSASRTSWIAFMAGVTVAFLVLIKKRSFFWVITRWLTVVTLSTLVMISFGDLSERFSHILKLEGVKNALTKPFRKPPENGLALDPNMTPEQQLAKVASKSDTPPTPANNGAAPKPKDVYDDPYQNVNDFLATTSGQTIKVNYSENALKYGLSVGIRLDVLWPNAIKAFKTNPFLGTGYSTLVKTNVWEFTVAESTDNDYLRMLGETGLFGILSFLSIIIIAIKILWQALIKTDKPYYYALFASGIGLTFGMLTNAMYIDVFESSKVAYAYWSLIGILLALAMKVIHAKNR